MNWAPQAPSFISFFPYNKTYSQVILNCLVVSCSQLSLSQHSPARLRFLLWLVIFPTLECLPNFLFSGNSCFSKPSSFIEQQLKPYWPQKNFPDLLGQIQYPSYCSYGTMYILLSQHLFVEISIHVLAQPNRKQHRARHMTDA